MKEESTKGKARGEKAKNPFVCFVWIVNHPRRTREDFAVGHHASSKNLSVC